MTKKEKWIVDDDDELRLFYGDEEFNGSAYPCNDIVFMKMIADKLNKLEKENEQLRQALDCDNLINNNTEQNKNCYNCKNRETYDEGEGYGFVSLCEKDCMNTDGYFDYEYHRFKKSCICPFWEEDKND